MLTIASSMTVVDSGMQGNLHYLIKCLERTKAKAKAKHYNPWGLLQYCTFETTTMLLHKPSILSIFSIQFLANNNVAL